MAKSSLNGLRSFLYSFARVLGDINAVSRGPRATAKRIGRRAAGRATGRAIRKIFK